jgi:uncharacterized phage-associated protein
MAFDARAVGNLILEVAAKSEYRITNLSLQKLLYFSHGAYLLKTGGPLVSGYFEAWQFGPVHPTAYGAFKAAGDKPIEFRASGFDPVTRVPREFPPIEDINARQTVDRVVEAYGGLSPGRLVDLSHAVNSPWHYVVENAKVRPMLGLRIGDNLIRERFKFHKVSVANEPRSGEPNEDAPFASD